MTKIRNVEVVSSILAVGILLSFFSHYSFELSPVDIIIPVTKLDCVLVIFEPHGCCFQAIETSDALDSHGGLYICMPSPLAAIAEPECNVV